MNGASAIACVGSADRKPVEVKKRKVDEKHTSKEEFEQSYLFSTLKAVYIRNQLIAPSYLSILTGSTLEVGALPVGHAHWHRKRKSK